MEEFLDKTIGEKMSPTEIILDFLNNSAKQFKDVIFPSVVEICYPLEPKKFDETAFFGGVTPALPQIPTLNSEIDRLTEYMRVGDDYTRINRAIIVAGVIDHIVAQPTLSRHDIAYLAQSMDSEVIKNANVQYEFASRKFEVEINKWLNLRKSDLSYEALNKSKASI